MDVTLEEPNVLILDLAEAQFDTWSLAEKDEILRIDNKFRALVGYPLRTEAFPAALGTSGNRRDPSSSRAPFPYPVGNRCESALAGPGKCRRNHADLKWRTGSLQNNRLLCRSRD